MADDNLISLATFDSPSVGYGMGTRWAGVGWVFRGGGDWDSGAAWGLPQCRGAGGGGGGCAMGGGLGCSEGGGLGGGLGGGGGGGADGWGGGGGGGGGRNQKRELFSRPPAKVSCYSWHQENPITVSKRGREVRGCMARACIA